jgi:hypothetical protein
VEHIAAFCPEDEGDMFGRNLCRAIALMMEAVQTSETSVYFNETTRHYIPAHCHLHTHRRENLKYHKLFFDFNYSGFEVSNTIFVASEPPDDSSRRYLLECGPTAIGVRLQDSASAIQMKS